MKQLVSCQLTHRLINESLELLFVSQWTSAGPVCTLSRSSQTAVWSKSWAVCVWTLIGSRRSERCSNSRSEVRATATTRLQTTQLPLPSWLQAEGQHLYTAMFVFLLEVSLTRRLRSSYLSQQVRLTHDGETLQPLQRPADVWWECKWWRSILSEPEPFNNTLLLNVHTQIDGVLSEPWTCWRNIQWYVGDFWTSSCRLSPAASPDWTHFHRLLHRLMDFWLIISFLHLKNVFSWHE